MHDSNREQSVDLVTGGASAGPSRAFGSSLNEEEKQVRDDYEWCLHDPDIQRLHGGQVVAVHRRRIWGVGPTHTRALQAALKEPGCPPRRALALVVVPDPRPALDASPAEEE